MEITKEIYESEYGYGYKIYVDGKLTIIQPHTPGAPGYRGMTSSEANEYADATIKRMKKPPDETMKNNQMPEEMIHAIRTVAAKYGPK